MTRAVVLAYHNVGVRCLKVLLAHGIEVPLVVTHAADSEETQWFGSSRRHVQRNMELRLIAPADPNAPDVVARVASLAPDFLFSFYYRRMLGAGAARAARRAARSTCTDRCCPKFRGRAPVNWAVLAGERETGATLHYMTIKPDRATSSRRPPVPILPDDTAREVFDKVTVAAEMTLAGVLPALVTGTAPRLPQDLARGSYFGGRRPDDGIIDWSRDATAIHNLVRAVAPPYPGAFTAIGGVRARILRTRVADAGVLPTQAPTLEFVGGRLIARCGGGGILQVLALEVDGSGHFTVRPRSRFGLAPLRFGEISA